MSEPSTPAELPPAAPSRVGLTQAAADLLVRIVGRHGPVMFHQSGGCCDGSAPMCYPLGELVLGDSDVHLGDLHVPGIDPVPVYISRSQHERWRHTHLTIDVVPGRGAGFSLESPEGVRFLTRSRLLTPAERQAVGEPEREPSPGEPPGAVCDMPTGVAQGRP